MNIVLKSIPMGVQQMCRIRPKNNLLDYSLIASRSSLLEHYKIATGTPPLEHERIAIGTPLLHWITFGVLLW